jgi:hypothetical protein
MPYATPVPPPPGPSSCLGCSWAFCHPTRGRQLRLCMAHHWCCQTKTLTMNTQLMNLLFQLTKFEEKNHPLHCQGTTLLQILSCQWTRPRRACTVCNAHATIQLQHTVASTASIAVATPLPPSPTTKPKWLLSLLPPPADGITSSFLLQQPPLIQQGRSSSRDSSRQHLCWYHESFGKRTKHCNQHECN